VPGYAPDAEMPSNGSNVLRVGAEEHEK